MAGPCDALKRLLLSLLVVNLARLVHLSRGYAVGRCTCGGFTAVEGSAVPIWRLGTNGCRHTVAVRPWSGTPVAV
jgi:hypothetical protein